MKFLECPNGRVWRCEADEIHGTINVFDIDLSDRQDLPKLVWPSLARTVCGEAEMMDITSYTRRGACCVSFTGRLSESLVSRLRESTSQAAESGWRVLRAGNTDDMERLQALIQKQYGLPPFEASHAVDALEIHYGPESVVHLQNSLKQLRSPAYPAECNYLRITLDGYELCYWNSDEFRENPESVMGALMGILSI